jgi:hypothetical protein
MSGFSPPAERKLARTHNMMQTTPAPRAYGRWRWCARRKNSCAAHTMGRSQPTPRSFAFTGSQPRKSVCLPLESLHRRRFSSSRSVRLTILVLGAASAILTLPITDPQNPLPIVGGNCSDIDHNLRNVTHPLHCDTAPKCPNSRELFPFGMSPRLPGRLGAIIWRRNTSSPQSR